MVEMSQLACLPKGSFVWTTRFQMCLDADVCIHMHRHVHIHRDTVHICALTLRHPDMCTWTRHRHMCVERRGVSR